MKNRFKTILTVLTVIAVGQIVNAIPPGTGSRHIRFTGFEKIMVPPVIVENGWMSMTSRYTLTIPGLKVTGLELSFGWLYYEEPGPDGTFHMYGSGAILNDAGEVIGAASFMNSGTYVAPPPIIEFYTDGTVVGTIWAGPYAGMVINANADIHAMINVFTGEEVQYDSALSGFLLVTDNVDPDALKDLIGKSRCRRRR